MLSIMDVITCMKRWHVEIVKDVKQIGGVKHVCRTKMQVTVKNFELDSILFAVHVSPSIVIFIFFLLEGCEWMVLCVGFGFIVLYGSLFAHFISYESCSC